MRHSLKDYNPPADALQILHEDEHILAVSKPSGLLSVPGRNPDHTDSVITRLQGDIPEALLIHRLDMDTSGVMVFAKNKTAQGHLGKQFEKRQTQKNYIADVWGVPDTDNGLIDMPLICDWDNRPRQKVCEIHGKPSQTRWDIADQNENFARLTLTPITGRSHQLRVHLAEIGHPILGDPFYANGHAQSCVSRLHLHAESITFQHPKTEQDLTITDSCPFTLPL